VTTTPTANYNWGKPVDGGDSDNWGLDLNTALDAIDAQVHTVAGAAADAAAAAGQKLAIGGNLSDLGSLPAALSNLGLTGTSGGAGWGGNWSIKVPVAIGTAVVQVIIQGGVVSSVSEGGTGGAAASPVGLSFPVPFTTACWGVYPVTRMAAFNTNSDCWAQLVGLPGPTGCQFAAQQANNNPTIDIPWIAIGF